MAFWYLFNGRICAEHMRRRSAAMENVIVGIDVSKDRLDIAVRPSGEIFAVERNAKGLGALAAKLKEMSPHLVALEATGGFETVVAASLSAAGFGVVVLNPAQIRNFAKATDRACARAGQLIFRFARSAIEGSALKPMSSMRALSPIWLRLLRFAEATKPEVRPLPADRALRESAA
jgi:Transposase